MLTLLIVLYAAAFIVSSCNASECACATLNVHIRDGAGTNHAEVGMLVPPGCLPYKGKQLVAGEFTWANVEYKEKDAWIATKWLTFKTCGQQPSGNNNGGSTSTTGCPNVVSRASWGARPPHGGPGHLAQTPKYIFVHHSATGGCFTKETCSKVVKSFQDYHMDSKHYSDIEYSFLVGEDGNVYEGRGWGIVGAHTLGHNHDGLGFCVIGTFTSHLPNGAALNALKQLIDCAAKKGHVISSYILKGHRDVRPTECPGQKFYELIKTWPHYG